MKVCTRLQHLHARKSSTSVSRSLAPRPGLSAHQDTASAQQVALVLRSDDRGMSHIAYVGLERPLEAGVARFSAHQPTASRFPAGPVRSASWQQRPPLSDTTNGPIALIGREQSRFNLVVAHIGIDDQELGALGDSIAGSVLPVGSARSLGRSRGSAGPARLAAFSSCRFRS